MKNVRFNQRGFSLIELMIVVAIIGILSAIAIPNFQRYQQKARQTEAKNNLAGFFSAQKATYAEYGKYAGNFVAVGFKPEGILKYRISAANNAVAPSTWTPAPTPNDDACIDTSLDCSAKGGATFKNGASWNEDASSVMAPVTCAPADDNTTFTACASGDIVGSGVAAQADTWRITEVNNLDHPNDELSY